MLGLVRNLCFSLPKHRRRGESANANESWTADDLFSIVMENGRISIDVYLLKAEKIMRGAAERVIKRGKNYLEALFRNAYPISDIQLIG